MELQLIIKSGERKEQILSLPHISDPTQQVLWIKENEPIEFRLVAPSIYSTAVLELYEHCIESTRIEDGENDGETVFIWTPKVSNGYRQECLFINYFGLADLNILLTEQDGQTSALESFQPIEVLASKATGDHVEDMFEFLASLPGETLHSVFSATRHGVGFEDGAVSPSFTQERLEYVTDKLQQTIPLIIQHPITRLVPEHKLVPTNGTEDIGEDSLGWLLENLSVLSESDNAEDAHLEYEKTYYKAQSLQMPVLENNADLYENRVLHGFVELLLHEAQGLISRYTGSFGIIQRKSENRPQGYTSFFDRVSRFKNQLMGGQLRRCEVIIDSLKQLKLLLESRLPVRRKVLERPIITPKARVNHSYRNVFIDIIKWHEKGKADWTAYENLFAIQSVPVLFEAYCYFRTANSLNSMFKVVSTDPDIKNEKIEDFFIDEQGKEVWLRREPIYWMKGHNNTFGETYVNSEGWTVQKNRSLNKRGQRGPWAQRSPDITIEIKEPNGTSKMIIMDAKYTYPDKAFINYLPELTMKYVHGIHQMSQGDSVVKSLSVMHPEPSGMFRSFHNDEFGVFGGHGRNTGHPVPPAQIRTCATNAYGSYFEYLARNRISGYG